MRARGVLAAALLAVSFAAVPAAAKPAPYVVWEIYRPGRGGSGVIEVSVHTPKVDEPMLLVMSAHLAPAGRSYRVVGNGLVVFWSESGTPRVYGAPCAPPLECETTASDAWMISRERFTPHAGHRYLYAAPRGAKVTVSKPWKARATALGMRVVRAEQADATGAVLSAVSAEVFKEAHAAGGAYGSSAFMAVPCEAGQWSLTDGAELDAEGTCPDWGDGFYASPARAAWSLTGPTVGERPLPVRLVVMDHPKP